MTKFFLSIVAVAALVAVPVLEASAQTRSNVGANYGYCKSGAKVKDTKNCKENGGNK